MSTTKLLVQSGDFFPFDFYFFVCVSGRDKYRERTVDPVTFFSGHLQFQQKRHVGQSACVILSRDR